MMPLKNLCNLNQGYYRHGCRVGAIALMVFKNHVEIYNIFGSSLIGAPIPNDILKNGNISTVQCNDKIQCINFLQICKKSLAEGYSFMTWNLSIFLLTKRSRF